MPKLKVMCTPKLSNCLSAYFIPIVFSCFCYAGGFAQEGVPKRTSFLIPQSSEVSLHSNIYWNLENTFVKGQWNKMVKQLRIQSYINYSDVIRIAIRGHTRFLDNRTTTELSELKFNYRNTFRLKTDTTFLRNGISIDAGIGKLQWFPLFTNPQVIFDNIDLYIFPKQFYGANLDVRIPLLKEKTILLQLRSHTGELINRSDVKPTIEDAYLRIAKFTKFKLGAEMQIGKAQGSQHVVNYAHLSYKPIWEKVMFYLKVGKLPSLDETPYGFHVGISRDFKFVALGGYYERRINRTKVGTISGIYFRIIGSSKLAKYFRAFNIGLGFTNGSIYSFLPLAKMNIQHK